MQVIFVDESGDIGLSAASIAHQPFTTTGYVYCDDPQILRKKMKRLLKRVHQKGKYPPHLPELKFYLPFNELIQKGYTVPQLRSYETFMPYIRTKAINVICKESRGIFAAVVDKRKAYKSWTRERLSNFVFAQTLIVDVVNVIQPPSPPIVIYDAGRLSPSRTPLFKTYVLNKDSYFQFLGLKRYRGSLAPPIEATSYNEPGIWAADMIAGAAYHKHAHRDWSYWNMLTPVRIGTGERLFW
jgi:hypothetical protein